VEDGFSADREAVALRLQERLSHWERPVVTDYELGVFIANQSAARSLSGASLLSALYKEAIGRLSNFGLLIPDKDFKPGTVFRLFGHVKAQALEVACSVDPFAYVSHLSAMEYHGLTDRFSKILYLTTPVDKEWRELAAARMERDLKMPVAAYRNARMPLLRRSPAERIEGRRVELMRRSNRGAFRLVKSPPLRIATLGRTFLDMLREPGDCGGILHVVDTYREHAAANLTLIVDEFERHGSAIDKVRAGFLLDEVCKLRHPLIDGWVHHARRGGSRVLDPGAEYGHHFSAKWMLSVNVPSLVHELAEGTS
jgi:predicted transcriptional regulator of viral defense system